MHDLISIGDVVVDTYIPLIDAKISESEGVNFLSLPYGCKIPVGPGQSMVAGNAANNAVGSARLKLKTAIYTNVGNKDEEQADDRIKFKLKKEGVDIRYIVENWDLPSNHNIVLEYKGERTILIHHQPWKFNLPDLDQARWIYLTSLSPTYVESNLIEQLINYLQRSGARLAFQPGTFQIKLGLRKSSKILSMTEIFFVNLEEAKLLLGFKMGEKVDIKKLLKKFADFGIRRVVITDGDNGSYGYDGETFYKLEIFPAKIVDKTGAGDSYATGTVAALVYGNTLADAMHWGAANSASVVEQIGAQNGLLTYSKMQEKLKENSKIVTKEF